jgi:hypothetical protein
MSPSFIPISTTSLRRIAYSVSRSPTN